MAWSTVAAKVYVFWSAYANNLGAVFVLNRAGLAVVVVKS